MAVCIAMASSALAADAAATDTAAETGTDTLIVTGTRTMGLKALDSAAPVEVVGSDVLSHVGQPNLIQGLSQLVPSFTAEAFGGDTANLTLTARLRGVSPNDTLVLVNGKRRHPTANLHVLGGPYQGAATADLDLIPVAAIDHVEILQDGAAAQYGTDAIAGVVNIILKHDDSGGVLSATGGRYYVGDGETGAGSAMAAFKFGEGGYIDLIGEYRFHGFSQRGGADRRVATAYGQLLSTTLSNSFDPAWANIDGYPRLNRILGDAQVSTTNLAYNGGYEFGEVEVYSFGTYSHKYAQAYENYRLPNRVIASPVLGVKGTYTSPGELIFAPEGFNPRETLTEDDYAFTGGIKGMLAGWHWDLSTTYGRDHDKINTTHSANASLFIDTHATPTNFYDGAFISSQWTNNLDITHDFEAGLAKPITLAFGLEHRTETYEIKSGDAASIYKEGGQSYPGFQPSDAGRHTRHNWAAYGDITLFPVEQMTVDGAVRYEHFSDFGDTTVGKITGRYDFSPAFALRGTASTGFRAPTLAEEYYSATNVSPTSAVVQLPANSAAAALLGFSNLKPEKSTNFSVGFVSHPVSSLNVTFDVYQITIKDRIVGTGTLFGLGGANNSAAVLAAIAAHGNILDPTVTFVGVSLFTNGIDTRTRGAEVAVGYVSDIGESARVTWTLAANYNETAITKTAPTPAPILASVPGPQALFDQGANSRLELASPKLKVGLGAQLNDGPWTVTLRETIYGPSAEWDSPDGGGTWYKNRITTTGILDLEVAYAVTHALKFALGANNLFDTRPPNRIQFPPTGGISDGTNIYDAPVGFSPFGINGGYWYARVTYAFD
ncbi:MAG TPA: TonB-dependent receptor [Caulobacteraceae bacterium]|nr:TonB-dependent receptor [Caulobacteraceae bacterium]